MKLLKDYLPLYLGCQILDPVNRTTHIIDYEFMNDYYDVDEDEFINDMRLILSPLKEATFLKYGFASFDKPSKIQEIQAWANCINRMSADGIDCDGLIEDGLAIDKTTHTH